MPTIKGRFGVMLLVAGAFLASAVPAASASELIAMKTSNDTLKVNRAGIARVDYKRQGKANCVLYRGALNAGKFASDGVPNAHSFKYDRSCGWKSKWITPAERKNFKNACGAYRGPALPYLVASCTAPDGSHWVLQKWARTTPNYGGNPNTAPKETRLSHFTGEPAKLTVQPNWSWSGRYMHIVATLQYQGKPWFVMDFSDRGYVLDGIGRNVVIDSYNSDMGPGWRRVNAILTHRPSGQMCYGFTPKVDRGVKSGTGYSPTLEYRLGTAGPGVSPDIEMRFTGLSLEAYNPAIDDQVDAFIRSLVAGWNDDRRSCQAIN